MNINYKHKYLKYKKKYLKLLGGAEFVDNDNNSNNNESNMEEVELYSNEKNYNIILEYIENELIKDEVVILNNENICYINVHESATSSYNMSNNNNFYKQLLYILIYIKLNHKKCLLGGDFNWQFKLKNNSEIIFYSKENIYNEDNFDTYDIYETNIDSINLSNINSISTTFNNFKKKNYYKFILNNFNIKSSNNNIYTSCESKFFSSEVEQIINNKQLCIDYFIYFIPNVSTNGVDIPNVDTNGVDIPNVDTNSIETNSVDTNSIDTKIYHFNDDELSIINNKLPICPTYEHISNHNFVSVTIDSTIFLTMNIAAGLEENYFETISLINTTITDTQLSTLNEIIKSSDIDKIEDTTNINSESFINYINNYADKIKENTIRQSELDTFIISNFLNEYNEMNKILNTKYKINLINFISNTVNNKHIYDNKNLYALIYECLDIIKYKYYFLKNILLENITFFQKQNIRNIRNKFYDYKYNKTNIINFNHTNTKFSNNEYSILEQQRILVNIDNIETQHGGNYVLDDNEFNTSINNEYFKLLTNKLPLSKLIKDLHKQTINKITNQYKLFDIHITKYMIDEYLNNNIPILKKTFLRLIFLKYMNNLKSLFYNINIIFNIYDNSNIDNIDNNKIKKEINIENIIKNNINNIKLKFILALLQTKHYNYNNKFAKAFIIKSSFNNIKDKSIKYAFIEKCIFKMLILCRSSIECFKLYDNICNNIIISDYLNKKYTIDILLKKSYNTQIIINEIKKWFNTNNNTVIFIQEATKEITKELEKYFKIKKSEISVDGKLSLILYNKKENINLITNTINYNNISEFNNKVDSEMKNNKLNTFTQNSYNINIFIEKNHFILPNITNKSILPSKNQSILPSKIQSILPSKNQSRKKQSSKNN